MNYTDIIMHITTGNNAQYLNNELTELEAADLLNKAVEKFKLRRLDNNCYENNSYYVYIGTFPHLHIAFDNTAGTIRKYSITTETELNKIPM